MKKYLPLFVITLVFTPFLASADTVTTTFGEYEITQNSILVTPNHTSPDVGIFEFSNSDVFQVPNSAILNYRCFNSQCNFNASIPVTLNPNKEYFIVTSASLPSTTNYQETALQINNAIRFGEVGDASFRTYLTHLYFKTDGNGDIICWDNTTGINPNPFNCSNSLLAVFVPLSFDLLPPTIQPLDLVANVTDGVQQTGQSIWPLFSIVGVSLAFIIALQLIVFIRRSTRQNKRQS